VFDLLLGMRQQELAASCSESWRKYTAYGR
jgi:hypothetical protein